jgi:methyltransferase-like protein
MAIVKHIKSRNANYSAAINYLLFEHNEKTGKKIVDESGRSILRKEFYMDGFHSRSVFLSANIQFRQRQDWIFHY